MQTLPAAMQVRVCCPATYPPQPTAVIPSSGWLPYQNAPSLRSCASSQPFRLQHVQLTLQERRRYTAPKGAQISAAMPSSGQLLYRKRASSSRSCTSSHAGCSARSFPSTTAATPGRPLAGRASYSATNAGARPALRCVYATHARLPLTHTCPCHHSVYTQLQGTSNLALEMSSAAIRVCYAHTAYVGSCLSHSLQRAPWLHSFYFWDNSATKRACCHAQAVFWLHMLWHSDAKSGAKQRALHHRMRVRFTMIFKGSPSPIVLRLGCAPRPAGPPGHRRLCRGTV